MTHVLNVKQLFICIDVISNGCLYGNDKNVDQSMFIRLVYVQRELCA